MSVNEVDCALTACNSVNTTVEGANRRRGTGYTRNEDLIVCKLFIAASEDALNGTSQKGYVFKLKMHLFFVQYLVEQEQLDALRYSSTLKLSTDLENIPPVYDRRNSHSIYTRFKEILSARVSKFLGVEKTTLMESGWDKERFYMAVKYNFEQKWPRLGNPDDIRHCVEYLKDKPKWHAFYDANNSCDDENHHKRPIGQKKEKALMKDKSMVKQVIRELKLPTKEINSSDDDTNLTKLSSNNEFMETVGAAMKAYCNSVKEQSDHLLIMSLASPQKKIIMDAKTSVMLEELSFKKAEWQAKRRRLSYENDVTIELHDSDEDDMK
jgi:hypothetical protein